LFCYVDANVAAEDQYGYCVSERGLDKSRLNAVIEPEGCNHQCWSEVSCT